MTANHERPRDGAGQWIRTTATAKRDAEAADLRSKAWTYQRIADHLGYSDRSEARHAVERALADITRESAKAVMHFELERLDEELVRLDGLEEKVRAVLDAKHITVNNGKVIHHPDTRQPMEDDAPVLQAVDRLLKIEEARRRNGERRAKLTGVEAAVKIDTTVHQVDKEDIELAELIREAQAKNAAEEARIKGETG